MKNRRKNMEQPTKIALYGLPLKNNMTRRLNAKKLFSFRETAFLFYCSTFLTFIFARTNSITAGNKDTNIIATIRSFKFF